MNDRDAKKIVGWTKQGIWKTAKGLSVKGRKPVMENETGMIWSHGGTSYQLDHATVDELAHDVFATHLRLGGTMKPQRYFYLAGRNAAINYLKKRAREKMDQLFDEPAGPDLSLDYRADEGRPGLRSAGGGKIYRQDQEGPESAPGDSVLRLLEIRFPEKYLFLQKSMRLIDHLYRVSLTRDNPNVYLSLCLLKTAEILSGAKREIDDMLFRAGPANFGARKFRQCCGTNISRWLQDEIDKAWGWRESIKGLPHIFGFPGFVIDAMPKLKADPIMLLMRVLYKAFKIGQPPGRYGARNLINRVVLELKAKQPTNEIFKSVSEKTNFETMRRKIYRKSKEPFYDKIADWICKTCQDS